MFMQAIKEALAFAALIVGMVGLPGMILLYLDWKLKRGWWFESR